MTVLVLTLDAPLQSWGADGAMLRRTTTTEPTFSGVVGLLANALGRRRGDPVDDLAELDFAVRCDAEGRIVRDYHIAGVGPRRVRPGDVWAGIAQADGRVGRRLRPTDRYYLADAAFLVIMAGPGDLIRRLHEAAVAPARPLFLGRRACPAGRLVRSAEPPAYPTLEDALLNEPLLRPPRGDRVRVALTSSGDRPWDRVVHDRPVGPAFATRTFARRRIQTRYLRVSQSPFAWVAEADEALDRWVPEEPWM